ncbi:Ancient ubiquitous protein 1, partial [Stegodyphus mimosarum]
MLLHNVREFMKDSNTPLLIFPEGTTTNGKKGLLKFNLWPFLLSEAVQPIRIKVARPKLMQVAFSVVGSRWWSDLFWFLFVPYTVFRIRFLPVAEREDTESAEMLCSKVQKEIGKELGLEVTTFTSADKVEYTKYILKEDGRC